MASLSEAIQRIPISVRPTLDMAQGYLGLADTSQDGARSKVFEQWLTGSNFGC